MSLQTHCKAKLTFWSKSKWLIQLVWICSHFYSDQRHVELLNITYFCVVIVGVSNDIYEYLNLICPFVWIFTVSWVSQSNLFILCLFTERQNSIWECLNLICPCCICIFIYFSSESLQSGVSAGCGYWLQLLPSLQILEQNLSSWTSAKSTAPSGGKKKDPTKHTRIIAGRWRTHDTGRKSQGINTRCKLIFMISACCVSIYLTDVSPVFMQSPSLMGCYEMNPYIVSKFND